MSGQETFHTEMVARAKQIHELCRSRTGPASVLAWVMMGALEEIELCRDILDNGFPNDGGGEMTSRAIYSGRIGTAYHLINRAYDGLKNIGFLGVDYVELSVVKETIAAMEARS